MSLKLLYMLAELWNMSLRFRLRSLTLMLVYQVGHLLVHLVLFNKVLWRSLDDPVVKNQSFLSHNINICLLQWDLALMSILCWIELPSVNLAALKPILTILSCVIIGHFLFNLATNIQIIL